MTNTVAPSKAILVDGGQTMPRRVVAGSLVTQTVGYGVLFLRLLRLAGSDLG
jgi:hypothetical protein